MTGAGVLLTILNGYGVNHIFCARLGAAPQSRKDSRGASAAGTGFARSGSLIGGRPDRGSKRAITSPYCLRSAAGW
jgi:hypothetical protein